MLRHSMFVMAVVSVGLLTSAFVSESSAQYGFGYGWNPYGGFYNSPFSSPYATGRIPTPPYFAIHPPVYYSHPVARPYGYSPFPYPGFVTTPELEAVAEPAIIENPYIQGTGSTPVDNPTPVNTDDDVAGHGPQEIVNPFVVSGVTSSQYVEYAP